MELVLTLVALDDRGAAQLTEPVSASFRRRVNFGRRVHPPPKLRRITLQRMIRPRYFSDHKRCACHGRGGLRFRIYMVVSARAEGVCILTLLVLKDRVAAQQAVPALKIYLSRRLIFRRSKKT